MIKIKDQKRELIQTITGGSLNRRLIQVFKREYEEGMFTFDIYLDGKVHSPANGQSILSHCLSLTERAVIAGEI